MKASPLTRVRAAPSRSRFSSRWLALGWTTLRSETGLERIALGLVALHLADDNFLQPEPGTSASEHLASGLVPVAVLAAVAAIYPRLRAGMRAATAMTLGAIAITVGVPAVYYLLEGEGLWRSLHRPALDRRRRGPARNRTGHALESPPHRWKSATRYLRRSFTVAAGPFWHGQSSGCSSSRSVSPTSTPTPERDGDTEARRPV